MPLNTVSFASVWVETKQEVLLYCTAARSSSNRSSLQDKSAPIPELLLPPCSRLCLAVWEVLQWQCLWPGLGEE